MESVSLFTFIVNGVEFRFSLIFDDSIEFLFKPALMFTLNDQNLIS